MELLYLTQQKSNMIIKKILITLSFLFSTMMVLGQGFSYTFTDPCTFKSKEIFINNPNGSVALIYSGQIQSFTQTQLLSGDLETWINKVNSMNPAGAGPCSGVGLALNTSLNAMIAANNIAILTTVMSSMSDISSLGGGLNIGGIIEAEEKSNSSDNKKNSNQGQNSSGGNGQSTNGTTNGTTNESSNQTTTPNGGSEGSNTNSQGTNSQSTNGTTNGNSNQDGGSNGNNSQGSNEQSTTEGGGQNTSNSGSSTINNQTQNNGTTNNDGGGSSSSESNQTNSQSQGNNETNSNTEGSNSGEGGTTTTEGGGTSGSGNSTQGGSTTTKSSVEGNSESNNTTDQKSDSEKINDANKSSSANSAQVKSKVSSLKKGGLMMTGDIVTISSVSGLEKPQLKVNMSIIKSNTKGTFAKGMLLNFTSSINNSCLTLFSAYKYKKSTTILANSSMLNFDKDLFNTTSLMESYKLWKITSTVGINYTRGNLGESKFTSLSALGGVLTNFKVTKKMGTTMMFVMVYSPYVYYYEGLWYESGMLAVPFMSVDYKLTKKFKFNISFSGVQQIKSDAINYQILLGAQALL